MTTALQNAIDAASAAGEGVYLPQGTYTISAPLNVNNVKVLGAGEWYTVLTGSNVEFNGNQNPASTDVDVSNLSMFGNVDVRDDSDTEVTAFNGGFSDSTISNVWIQNEKVGVWIIGPSTDLTLTNLRIQDTTADGINLDALRRSDHRHDDREQLPAQHPGRRDRAVVAELRRHRRHRPAQHRRHARSREQRRRVRRGLR